MRVVVLGVIEHFYDGYEDVLDEIYRVIKDRGYLFLVFLICLFRKLKGSIKFLSAMALCTPAWKFLSIRA